MTRKVNANQKGNDISCLRPWQKGEKKNRGKGCGWGTEILYSGKMSDEKKKL